MTRNSFFCNNNIHTHKIYKHTLPILNENKEDSESISPPSSDQRHNYERNINGYEKNILHKLRPKNPQRIVISQININSRRNKFDYLTAFTKNKIDILMISKIKLDSSFP